MSETRKSFSFAALGLILLASAVGWWWYFGNRGPTCHPTSAEALLSSFVDRGIQRIHHPPSLSNLLWVTVGPEWHALSKKDKDEIDKVVRCAATVIDDLGQPTWQAAYYDSQSGELVALTSKKYGFRLKAHSNL